MQIIDYKIKMTHLKNTLSEQNEEHTQENRKCSQKSQNRKPKAHLDGSRWSKWVEPKEENNISPLQSVKQQDNQEAK